MSKKIITSVLLEEDPTLIDLINKFMSRLPNMVASIMAAYDEKDWESFSGLIHQMKGVGGNYGYPALSEICFSIESLAREENYTAIKKQLDQFDELHHQILAGDNENQKIANETKL